MSPFEDFAKSSATGKRLDRLIALLDHFSVYIGQQVSILPRHATSRLAELASHNWRTVQCFLLAYLRPGRIEINRQTDQILPIAEFEDKATSRQENLDDCTANYETFFNSVIEYPDSEIETPDVGFQNHHILPKLAPIEFYKPRPYLLTNSATEILPSIGSAAPSSSVGPRYSEQPARQALEFSRHDLDYVGTLSDWIPVIYYHPSHNTALSRNPTEKDPMRYELQPVKSPQTEQTVMGPALATNLNECRSLTSWGWGCSTNAEIYGPGGLELRPFGYGVKICSFLGTESALLTEE